jgi:uncharacterized protein YbjT (DUF2867 family)
MSKLLVVFGVTGQQGGSVVQAILTNKQLSKEYVIRGTTRDPSQPRALALVEKGVEIVKADVDDLASLQKAFEGAHVVFSSTVTVYDGHTYEHEVNHGRALVDAAVSVGVPYYIYSTLPNAGKNSGGKLTHMGHFDGKEEVEQYIRSLPIQSAFIAPGSFMSNFHDSMTPRPLGNDGTTYALFNFVHPDTQLPLIDTAGDTGKWVAAILTDFPKYKDQVLCCCCCCCCCCCIPTPIRRPSGAMSGCLTNIQEVSAPRVCLCPVGQGSLISAETYSSTKYILIYIPILPFINSSIPSKPPCAAIVV